MADICPTCGEEGCAEKRAAFAREPWLPNGFELGAQWTSFDNGMTWHRFPPPQQCNGKTGTMTIVAIDQKTGTITAKAS